MATKLHELLAVMGDRATAASQIAEEAKVTFLKRADHFKGQTRTVEFFDEGRAAESTTDTKEFVETVESKVDYVFGHLGKYWDALLTLETANGTATADLVVGGKTLAKGVPATFLLGMETRLKELRTVLLTMPTLAPEITWSFDADAGKGVYVSAPQTNFKTEKQVKHKVLYDATDKHPAQIEKWNEDVPVAKITTVHRSTMISPARKAEMLGRVDELISAVKQARQRANSVEIVPYKIAGKMFDHILNG